MKYIYIFLLFTALIYCNSSVADANSDTAKTLGGAQMDKPSQLGPEDVHNGDFQISTVDRIGLVKIIEGLFLLLGTGTILALSYYSKREDAGPISKMVEQAFFGYMFIRICFWITFLNGIRKVSIGFYKIFFG